jgi:hypothetical protein
MFNQHITENMNFKNKKTFKEKDHNFEKIIENINNFKGSKLIYMNENNNSNNTVTNVPIKKSKIANNKNKIIIK